MVSFFAEVKIFIFWPKTMDYNKAFWPKSSSFFGVLLLLNGRCYEAEICVILLPLRCSFRWYAVLLKSTFSDFDRKPWTIVRRFDQISFRTNNSSLEDAMKLQPVPFRHWSEVRLSVNTCSSAAPSTCCRKPSRTRVRTVSHTTFGAICSTQETRNVCVCMCACVCVCVEQ